MKRKQILFGSVLVLLMTLAGITEAQVPNQNQRQIRLERTAAVNLNRAHRIEARNPVGLGRRDNRINRKARRIACKQKRADRRVNRRRGMYHLG